MFLLSIKFLISFAMYSKSLKLLKCFTLLSFTDKGIQWVPTNLHLSTFIKYVPFFILGKQFFE